MVARKHPAADFFCKYGLAIMCVVAPLLLSSATEAVIDLFAYRPISASIFSYEIRSVNAAPTPRAPSAAAKPSSAEEKVKPDPRTQLVAQFLAGQFTYAAASGFRYLVALAGIIFGALTVGHYLGRRRLAQFAVLSLVIAGLTGWGIGLEQRGALFLAGPILSKAVHLPPIATSRAPNTGAVIITLEGVNYAIGMFGVLMTFFALFAAAIRGSGEKPTFDLDKRLTTICIGLGLTSASLVVGVLSTRSLLAWSLSLFTEPQQIALKPLADAVVMQWGTIGTVAVLAAVIPAIVAWQIDAASRPATAHSGKKEQTTVHSGWMPLIAALITALAPILTSPFIDAMKAIVGAFSK
jgi:hypothetical protein